MSRPHSWMRVASLTTTGGNLSGRPEVVTILEPFISTSDSLLRLRVVLLDEIEEQLRAAGLRVTASRVAVLRVLAEADDHPRIDQVLDRVRTGG